ncbi:uncharacterized protein LOC143530128 [Bidens hawaiensis]|uniref:uncharacterized protein LOC143530128 n=1 Tax=Bidens hawaiensis TaxID=980011 RepID=UPI00404A4A41
MNIASYKFDVSDSSNVFLSLVASVTIVSRNPNRVGIRYDFSRLKILDNGLVVGMIRIPEFYQPPRSHNVSIQVDILLQRVDLSTVMSGAKTSDFPIKVLGNIELRLWVLQIKLPKIKVGLDCDVAVDSRYLISTDEILSLKAVKNRIAHSQAFSQIVL